MLYTCVQRFNVIGERENILGLDVKWTHLGSTTARCGSRAVGTGSRHGCSVVSHQVGTGGGRGRDAFASLAEASGLGSAAMWCFALLPVAGSRVACWPGSRVSTRWNSINFVLFDKYCLIVDQLGSKNSSHDFQLNCVISYFFNYI
jgi:hypothetical protein